MLRVPATLGKKWQCWILWCLPLLTAFDLEKGNEGGVYHYISLHVHHDL